MIEAQTRRARWLDGMVRAFELTSALDFNVVLAADPGDIAPFVREFVARACQPGLDLRVRWIAWSGLDATTTAIESLMVEQGGERRILVIDLSAIRRDESRAATRFAGRLNLRRDPFGRRFVGTFLLALPAWLEADFASAAPDLWSVMTTMPLARMNDLAPRLDAWWQASEQVFAARLAARPEARPRYALGTMTIAYVLEPGILQLASDDLHTLLARVPGYTGWRPWWVPGKFVPQQRDTALECWMFGPEQMFPDPAHSDYWRASGDGMLYLVRGFEEDSRPDQLVPGRFMSADLPLVRCAEMLLHAHELCSLLGARSSWLRMRVRWSGLAARVLTTWPDRLGSALRNACEHALVDSEVELESDRIVPELAETVAALTRPLFDGFDRYRLPAGVLEQRLDDLLARRPM